MTAFAIALLAAILPLRYGTPAEKEVLAEDRAFLAKAYVERHPNAMFPPAAATNTPHELSFWDKYIDSYIAEPDTYTDFWVVPGYFMNVASSGSFFFSQATNGLTSGVWFPFDAVTNEFGIGGYSPCCTNATDKLSLDWMRRAFYDVQNTRFSCNHIPAQSYASTGIVTFVTHVTGNYYGWSGQGHVFEPYSSTNTWGMSGHDRYNLLRHVDGNNGYSTNHEDNDDHTPYVCEDRLEDESPSQIDIFVYGIRTNATAVWCVAGYIAYERKTRRHVASNTYDYEYKTGRAVALFPLVKVEDGTWKLPQGAFSDAAGTVASHFGMSLSAPSLGLEYPCQVITQIGIALPQIVIEDLRFEANGDGWGWGFEPE